MAAVPGQYCGTCGAKMMGSLQCTSCGSVASETPPSYQASVPQMSQRTPLTAGVGNSPVEVLDTEIEKWEQKTRCIMKWNWAIYAIILIPVVGACFFNGVLWVWMVFPVTTVWIWVLGSNATNRDSSQCCRHFFIVLLFLWMIILGVVGAFLPLSVLWEMDYRASSDDAMCLYNIKDPCMRCNYYYYNCGSDSGCPTSCHGQQCFPVCGTRYQGYPSSPVEGSWIALGSFYWSFMAISFILTVISVVFFIKLSCKIENQRTAAVRGYHI